MTGIEHYRDALHTYLVLPEPEQVQEGGYQYRMLAANKISGLLPCGLRRVNDENRLCYDITARQKVSVFYGGRGLGAADLHRLAADLTELRERLSSFLLDMDHLLLTAEYVYYDLSTEHFLFLYYPDGGGRSMETFFGELAELVREDDREAAALAYRLAGCAGEQDLLLQRLAEEAEGETGRSDPDVNLSRDPGAGDGQAAEAHLRGEQTVRGEAEGQGTGRDPGEGAGREAGPVRTHRSAGEDRNTHRLAVAAALLLLACVATAAYPAFFYVTEREYLLCRCFAIFFLTAAAADGILLLVRFLRTRHRNKAAAELKEEDLRLFREEMRKEERKDRNRQACTEPGETVFLGFGETRAVGLYSDDPGTPNIDLRRLPLTVGRNGSYAERVIDSEGISRMHVRFDRDAEGELTMRDLNSTNGTWLNGQLLDPEECVRFHRGDEIRIGEAVFQCR